MRISYDEAFSLAPVYELKVGAKTYSVPPLTFGRFQRLLGTDIARVANELKKLHADGPVDEKVLVNMLADMEPAAFLPAALAVIPGMTKAGWKDATSVSAVAVLLFLFAAHDWKFVGDMIGFGTVPPKDAPPAPNAVEFAGVLISVAKALDVAMPELLDLRVEGFYLCVAALKDQREKDEAAAASEKADAQEEVQRVVLPVIKRDPAAGESALDRAIREADEATARGENAGAANG